MKQLGQNMSQADVDKMIKEVDTDNSGSIEFNEFCVYMINKFRPKSPDDIRKKTFQVRIACSLRQCDVSKACDKDGDGFVGPEEFVEIMKQLGDDTITLEQAKSMIKRVDKDGNEKISYDGKIKWQNDYLFCTYRVCEFT